jgi:16S rRNA (guanine966-N2)-methyltransferase
MAASSEVRIIAGEFRGRRLSVPKGGATRPTAQRVREGIMSALESRDLIRGAVVLDLFAGTGACGLECLSRGASEAHFVDSSSHAIRAISNAARAWGASSRVRALQADVFRSTRELRRTLRVDQGYDLVFVDPPYDRFDDAMGWIEQWVRFSFEPTAPRLVAARGWLVLENARRDPPPEYKWFEECHGYLYGDTRVTLARPMIPSEPMEGQSP